MALVLPYCLNPVTLHSSWTNKGGHTRTRAGGAGRLGDYDADNWHADHHTLHGANFGSAHGVLLDFYFGTAGRTTRGAWGKRYAIERKRGGDGEEEAGAAVLLRISDVPAGETNRSAFAPTRR